MVGEQSNTDSRKRNVGKTKAKHVFGTKSYSQYQVWVTLFSAYNILHNNSQKEIEDELKTLLFRQGVSDYRKKTAKSQAIYKLHHLTFRYLSGVQHLAKGVVGKRDVIYRWRQVYEWIFDNRKSLMADFLSAVGGVVDADAQIEEAKKILGEKGYKQYARVKCSLEHGFEMIGVIVRVLSRTVVEVLAEDTSYELHTSLVEVIE